MPQCAWVVDHDGRRGLTAEELTALVARAAEFDLFIDTTITVAEGTEACDATTAAWRRR